MLAGRVRIRVGVAAHDDVNGPRWTAKFNVARFGHSTTLPDTYALSADELALVMTQWRELALTTD